MSIKLLQKQDGMWKQLLDSGRLFSGQPIENSRQSLDPKLNQFFQSLAIGVKDAQTLDDYLWIKEAASFWESAFAERGRTVKIVVPEPRQPLKIPGLYPPSDEEYESAVRIRAYRVSQDRKKRIVEQLQDLINKEGVNPLIDNPALIFQMIGGEEEQAKNDWFLANQFLILEYLNGTVDFSRMVVPESYWHLEATWLSYIVKMEAYLVWENNGAIPSPSSHLADYYGTWTKMCDRLELPMNGSMALFDRVMNYISWLCAEAYVDNYYSNIAAAVNKDQVAMIRVLRALDVLDKTRCGNEMINCFEMMVAVWYLDGDMVREIRVHQQRQVAPAV